MKKELFLAALCCCLWATASASVPAAPPAAETETGTEDRTETTAAIAPATDRPEFPEPEFIVQALAIRPDDKTEQIPQESLIPRHRSSTGQKLFGIGKDRIDEVTLKGPRSLTRFHASDGIAFIICVPDNRIDPMSVITILKFKVKRKMRVAEYASVGAFGDRQINTLERQPFTARRFGGNSYLVVLKDARPGEYGITVDALGSLNISTFGVDE